MSHPTERRKELSPELRRRVGLKIGKLVREGKTREQAAGQAFSMGRAGTIGPRGGKKEKK